ncbi:MAG: hypothetical protein Q8L57_00745, partial [bacterium]|nr:hypothetical protein [bacterium]
MAKKIEKKMKVKRVKKVARNGKPKRVKKVAQSVETSIIRIAPERPEKFIAFLLKDRTQSEIEKEFKLSKDEIGKLLLLLKPENFLLRKQTNANGEDIFRFLPQITGEMKPRIWTSIKESTGKPGVAIIFPEKLGWKKIRIIPISDVLYNDSEKNHDRAGFEERINWIAREPHVFTFLNGDIFKKPAKGERDSFDFYVFDLIEKLRPIAHKILWVQQGCEEERIESLLGEDSLETVCVELGIANYFKAPIYAEIHWEGQIFTFYCIHGTSAARKKGSKLNAVVQLLESLELTQFIAYSHIRDSIAKKKNKVCEDR